MRVPNLLVLVLLLSLQAAAVPHPLQQTEQDEHTKAFELYSKGEMAQALPILEKLYSADPSDVVVEERYGFALFATVNDLPDSAARKAQRAKARKLLVEVAEKTKANGRQSQLATVGYDIPEDGGDDVSFSSSKEVDKFMQTGEQLFAKGAYDEAVAQYQAALTLDPKLYTAALFIGDSYFRKQRYKEANTWFQRAVEINPDIETAHRYWGDSLMKSSHSDLARDQYTEAIIAEPYNQRAWIGLANWAKAERKILAHPVLQIPAKIENGAKPGDMNITLDSSTLEKGNGAGAAWLTYSLSRATWRGEKFQKAFPEEKEYRHSLAEELDSFSLALSVAKESKVSDKDLELVRRLKEKGLLESFILISRADDGLAKDYEPYRRNHRQQLRQYILEFVVSK